jgi:hypothetical protein
MSSAADNFDELMNRPTYINASMQVRSDEISYTDKSQGGAIGGGNSVALSGKYGFRLGVIPEEEFH